MNSNVIWYLRVGPLDQVLDYLPRDERTNNQVTRIIKFLIFKFCDFLFSIGIRFLA